MGLYAQFLSIFYGYLRTGAKRGARNPKWLLMFILSRFRIFRFLVISTYEHPSAYKIEESIFQELDVDRTIKALREDGSCLGIKLPSDSLHELLEFVHSSSCYANGDSELGFSYARKREAEEKYGQSFVRADYFNAALLCPTISELAHDPKILEIASQYLGGKPLYTGSRLWWLFAKREEDKALLTSEMMLLSLKKTPREGSYFFHYDLDDYRCLKFFFYLTEVDASGGPHCCVRGSHERKKISHLFSPSRRCPDQDIEEFYGSENIKTICGEPGSGFIEDTFCFHKATIPSTKNRLVLLIQFTLNDYGNQTDAVDFNVLKNLI
jgi:hypothetical protein